MKRFALFIVAGGIAALANFGSRIALSEVIPYVPAIMVAYCIGMTTAFVLNRAFVFTSASNSIAHQATWFVLVNVAAVTQTVLVSLLFARVLFPRMGVTFHSETIAHAIGVVLPVFTSYLGHKHFSFRGVTLDAERAGNQ